MQMRINVVSWLAKYATGTGTNKKDKCVNIHIQNVEVLTSSGNKASPVLKSVYCLYPVFFLKDLISPCGNEPCIEFDGIVKASESSLVLSPEQQLDCVTQRNMLVGFVQSS